MSNGPTIVRPPEAVAAAQAEVDRRALSAGGAVAEVVREARAKGNADAEAYLAAIQWELDHPGVTPPVDVVGAIRAGMRHFGITADDVQADVATMREVRTVTAVVAKLDEQIASKYDRSPRQYHDASNEQARLAEEAAEPFFAKQSEYHVLGNRMRVEVDSRNRHLGRLPSVHPRLAEVIERPEFKDAESYHGKPS